VRGYRGISSHYEILEKFMQEELKEISIDVLSQWSIESPGGGRIMHTNTESEKKMQIYSYSKEFGKADHTETKEIIAKYYPEY
jgi:hypothetical protein